MTVILFTKQTNEFEEKKGNQNTRTDLFMFEFEVSKWHLSVVFLAMICNYIKHVCGLILCLAFHFIRRILQYDAKICSCYSVVCFTWFPYHKNATTYIWDSFSFHLFCFILFRFSVSLTIIVFDWKVANEYDWDEQRLVW